VNSRTDNGTGWALKKNIIVKDLNHTKANFKTVKGTAKALKLIPMMFKNVVCGRTINSTVNS
jgi:hypothetical protein